MADIRSRRFSRRQILGASGALGAAALVGAPSVAAAAGPRLPNAIGALGANFNESIADVDVRELQIGRARWVRGFYPVPKADEGDPADDPTIRTILHIGARGYQTIFTLKFPYNNSVMPTPGSPEMQLALSRVDKILPLVLGRVDILEIGNEPFIESRPADRGDALNVFYETVARHIIAYGTARRGRTRLYLGALNRLDLPDRQTPAAQRWMTFARQTPEIEGVDIHPHVPSPDAIQPFLDYILPRLRADQTFLVTEFSLVWHWQAHMQDVIPAQFADRYGFSPDTVVWQVIQAAIQRPFGQSEWNEFLSMSPWFESQKHFLRDQMQRFRATGRLAVAAYSYSQIPSMVQNFGPNKVPWLLNAVFAPYTVQPWRNGTTGRGYAWIDDFRELQRGVPA